MDKKRFGANCSNIIIIRIVENVYKMLCLREIVCICVCKCVRERFLRQFLLLLWLWSLNTASRRVKIENKDRTNVK